jgi:hypothetical protein
MAIHENISFKEYIGLDGFNASLLKPYSISPKYGYYMERKPFKKSRAMSFGTLCHSYILEGLEATHKLIDQHYITDGWPVNERIGKPYGEASQKWQDWLKTIPKYKSVLMPDDFDNVMKIAEAVESHSAASNLLSRCNKRETAITWKCQHTGQDMKALVDAFGTTSRVALDLKTFGRSMSVGSLESEIYNRQYHLQFAMYQDGLIQNNIDCDFYVIFVSTKDDYDVCCAEINYTALEQGRDDYIQAIANYHKARQQKTKQGQFPDMINLGVPYYAVKDIEQDCINQLRGE